MRSRRAGCGWIAAVISASAVIGIASVLFAFMLGAARIWFALARDGLLPGWFAKVHPTYGTPHRPTIVLGVFTALVAGLFPLGEVAKLVNIGVLSAFIVICASVILLRVRKPELPRTFRTPWVPLIPLVGIAFSIWLLSELALITWMVFVVWVAIGLWSTSATESGTASSPDRFGAARYAAPSGGVRRCAGGRSRTVVTPDRDRARMPRRRFRAKIRATRS